MSSPDTFPPFFPRKLPSDFDRGDIDEFVEKYTFEDGQIREYKKAKRLENITESIAIGSLLVVALSFLALILIPAYSIAAKFVINFIGVPEILSNYISGTPKVETSTLFVVGVLCVLAFILTVISIFISSSFGSYATDTGLDSTSVEFQKLALSYKEFKKGNYNETIEKLREYDNYRSKKYVNKYVTAVTLGDGTDDEFIENTFSDFFGLLIEEIHITPSTRQEELESIYNRFDCDYYIEEEAPQQPEEKEYRNTYFGIIRSTFADLFSGVFGKFSSFSINRPMVVHFAFLAIGIWLIQINATLAIIAITILTGGFGSWRRSRLESNREERPPQ